MWRQIFSNPQHRTPPSRLVFPAGRAPRARGICSPAAGWSGWPSTAPRPPTSPLVASLAIECSALVSIVAADTRLVHGQTLGSMLLALPEDEAAAQRAIDYISGPTPV